MRALVERWRGGYDWRAAEALTNGWGSSRTLVGGLGIHFLHVRSPEPDAVPLLLAHGWPGSVLEPRDTIGPLSDPAAHGGDPRQAFHLVIPSMPGFGFSNHPEALGWDVARAAGTVLFRPTDEEVAEATPEERAMLAGAARYEQELSGYMRLQNTRPQSVAFALADSPVGLAAWIYALFRDVTDSGGAPERVIPLDHLIDGVMMCWLPNAGASAARFHWENARAQGGMPAGPIGGFRPVW